MQSSSKQLMCHWSGWLLWEMNKLGPILSLPKDNGNV